MKTRYIRTLQTTVRHSAVALALALSPVIHAAPPAGGRLGQPPEPPPEAVQACEGKSEGDSVTITLPDGTTVEAVCAPHGDQLAARPAHPPAHPGATRGSAS